MIRSCMKIAVSITVYGRLLETLWNFSSTTQHKRPGFAMQAGRSRNPFEGSMQSARPPEVTLPMTFAERISSSLRGDFIRSNQ